MNKLFFLGGFILISTLNILHAQLTGGTGRGMETPTTAKPEESLTTLSDGDVDLFSGVYQHSINLGTVSTTTGTSFTLTMNYSSSGVTSRFQNQDNTIPLGEGWSLNLPYIKFITDTPQKKYSNYVYQQKLEQYNQAMYSNTVFDSSSSIAGIFTFCEEEKRSEFVCKIKGINVNLPGIYSGMMTYKYSNTLEEAVFVPKTFDKYFELTFKIFGNKLYGYELMPEAIIRLNDGTVYEFNGFDYHYVNPPNILGASETAKPVMVYDGLGISRIWNPHLSEYESIDFIYSSYGRVNHFAEFNQFIVNRENFSTASETRLDEILVNDGMSSKHISQRLKLNYKLYRDISVYSGGQFTYLDSMYIMKTIFNSGEIKRPLNTTSTPNIPWTDWNKYYHAAAAPSNAGWTNTQTNWLHNFPYVFNGSQERQTNLSNANKLEHSYIELTNIDKNLFKSGRMYEIRVAMQENQTKCAKSLLDIDFLYSNSTNEHSRSSGVVSYPRYNSGHKRGTVMSTFYRPFKWFDDGHESVYNPATHKYEIHENTSSNFFIAPDPVDANFDANTNFILKIGPANSDNYMDVPMVNMTKTYPNGLQLSLFSHTHRKTYWNYRDATTFKNLKCYKYCEPCGYNFISPNFGLGLPWGQSLGLYDATIPGTTTNACSDISHYFNFSHYYGTADYNTVIKARPNRPTAFNDFTIKSVQITELEKIPVMLSEVRLYDYRNAVKAYIFGDNSDEGSKYANTVNEESNLVSIKRFEWSDGTIPNFPKSGITSYNVNKYLLTQLFSFSINSTDNYKESFGYTKVACSEFPGSVEQNMTNNFNSQFYLLTSIVNNLGLKKTIAYQPASRFRFIKGDVVQFNFIVNSITKEPALATGSTGEQKITHYDFKDPQSAGLCYDTRKDGFGDVTVLHPIIPGTTSRKRTNYTFDVCKGCNLALRCMPDSIKKWLTYGKLLRVIDYNENLEKIKEVNYEYKKLLAFKNGLKRYSPLSIECAYADGGDYNQADPSAKYSIRDLFTGNYRPLTIEFNPDNHSYFTPKSKVTTTEFFNTKAGGRTSTDFIEEYEYYDADFDGTYHNDGQKIINENVNSPSKYNIDPSWNLYKTVSYSTANPSFKTMKEIFYMYQFLDRDMDCTYNLDEGTNGEDNSFFWSSNVVKILFLKYRLKDLITEIRTSNITETNTGSFDTLRKSKYFKYDLTYIDNENYNDNLPEEETIYDSTFKKTKCKIFDPEDIEKIRKDSAIRAIDSINNVYIERGCDFFFTPKFGTLGPGGIWVSSDGQKMEDWDEKRRYYETINGGCYIRRFDARIGKWVRCPCSEWDIKMKWVLWEGIGHRTANFIGLRDLINLKGITASPSGSNSPLDPIVLVGTSGVVGGYSPAGSRGNYHQLTPMQKQEIKPSFNSTKDGELESIVNRNAKYSINAFDESKIYSIINDSLTNEVGFLVLPTLNKLVTINMDKLGDFNSIKNLGNPHPFSEQNHADIIQGMSYLMSRFTPENIIPIGQFVATVNPIEVLPHILKENGEGDPPPRYYPPEHNMRILFKSEHEKVDDLVISPSGQWRSSPETRYDIGRFTNLSTLSYHIPFNNIKQKEILLRNNFLQTELEMDAKQMLTKYYYGNYSFKKVCNSKKCPDINGNMVPSGECHRAMSYNSMFLPVRITTGFYQPDSIGINLYYNKNATLSHTISDQGARIDYKYDGFNRLIETKKDGNILARYKYNMWDRGSYTGIDAITNQNFIETRTWLNKTNHEGTISRSFIDPFGRKTGSILATSANLTTSPTSYTDAIMSGYQQLDWEEKPLKQYKPFQVTGGLQLYRNTTTSGSPSEHQQFTYDFKSQPLRSYDFDVSTGSSHYSESNTTLEDGNYFNSEIQPNALEKAILGWNATHKYLRTESRDPDGKKHISYSHVNGKKMADHIFMGGAASNINTLYGYDRKWDLKKVLDPEKMETTYLTNLQGLVFEKLTPDQGMSLYFYDEVGSLVAMQDKKLWTEGLLRMRVFTYDHFGRMLMQLVGNLNAKVLCPTCGYGGPPTTGGGGSGQNYRPTNPMAYALYPGARHYDISYPPHNTNPVLPNSYGRSYHWLPNKNVLDENGEGKYTIFDSLINIKVEKHFVYNDTSQKYINSTDMSPNHNALYKTKLNEIIATLGADVKSEIGAKKQKSLGKLSTATSYDHMGNINEIVSTTYNADELPENEYHYARFQPYITQGASGYTKQFLVKYKDYDLTGKPAEVELLDHKLGGGTHHIYSTKSAYNALGHLTKLQYKQGISATTYEDLADYNYHLPSGKLTDVEARMNASFSLKTFYTYDSRERLTHINSNMFEEKLFYDNNFPTTGIGTNIANYNGNINAVYTHHKGCAGLDPMTYKYQYDAANRLSKAFSDAKMMPSGAAFGSQEFSYLRNGSMQSFTTEELNTGGMSTTLRNNYFHYFAGTNMLDKISPTAGGSVTSPIASNNRSFTYDKNGNVITDNLRDQTMSYDRANLPFKSVKANGSTQVFGYNTADARIFKGNDAIAHYYLAGSVYDLKNDKWEHYPGGLAVHKNNSLNLIIKDHLTNTRAIVMDGTDACPGSMTYQAQYDYYPYGKVLRKVENPRSRFQSTDHETDSETGYNNRNARWYDDESFQFLQTDPMADIYPSLSPYNYVERNPISLIDPTGMYSTEEEVKEQFEAARSKGYKVENYYKTGEIWGFNTASTSADGTITIDFYHKSDFKTPLMTRFENGLFDIYNGSPSWITGMDEKGSWAHKGLSVIGDMCPNVSVVSLFTGKGSSGEDMHRGWAVLNLATFGNATKAKVAYQSHHLIPNQIFRESAEQLSKMGWMQNHVKNLMQLPTPFHGNHPAYNNFVRKELEGIIKSGTLDDLVNFQNRMRVTIQGLLDDGVKNLNSHYKSLGF